ncbi:MFS transporter [Spirillospora sp. NPDC127200]
MPADLPSDLPADLAADLDGSAGPGRARPTGGDGASRRAPGWLWALTLATFAMSTDDYVVAGVLPGIAEGLRVGEPAAGQLVTVFSLVFAVASPVLAVVTARWPRGRLLTGALVVFVAANLVVPLVTGYWQLMALRVVAALAAAAVVPGALALAAGLAPPDRQGRYLSLVMTGLTGAFVVGVPLGAWVAAATAWQGAFVLGGLLGLAALIALRRTLPGTRADTAPASGPAPQANAAETRPGAAGAGSEAGPGHEEEAEAAEPGLRERLSPLTRAPVLVGLAGAAVLVLGNMLLLTYLAPFLHGLAGAGPGALGLVFVLAGLAGIAGGRLGGRATDRWGPGRALAAGGALFAASMAGLAVCWALRPVALAAALPLLAVWSLAAWWVPPPTAARLLALAGPAGPQALALNSSAVYLGVSGGGALGGALLARYGGAALPVAGAVAALAGLALFACAGRLARR